MTEKWAYFFKHAEETTEEELSKIIGDDLILGRAYEELNRFSWTLEQLREYNSVDMKRWADKGVLEAAIEDGINKGKTEEKFEIAEKMIIAGMSLEDIGKFTGLSIKELSTLNSEKV
jgi:predicted transposase/invertase (TIGR01784 family)